MPAFFPFFTPLMEGVVVVVGCPDRDHVRREEKLGLALVDVGQRPCAMRDLNRRRATPSGHAQVVGESASLELCQSKSPLEAFDESELSFVDVEQLHKVLALAVSLFNQVLHLELQMGVELRLLEDLFL